MKTADMGKPFPVSGLLFFIVEIHILRNANYNITM